jgi:hypothetical protein
MTELQRGTTSASVIDVLDHVLDKGIVIDAWVRVSLIGIDLITVEARIVVASIDTYVNNADAVAQQPPTFAAFTRAPVWHPPPPPPNEQGTALPNPRTRKR